MFFTKYIELNLDNHVTETELMLHLIIKDEEKRKRLAWVAQGFACEDAYPPTELAAIMIYSAFGDVVGDRFDLHVHLGEVDNWVEVSVFLKELASTVKVTKEDLKNFVRDKVR